MTALLAGAMSLIAATPSQVPVAAQADVVVVGGGCGAVAAAVEASKAGAKVFLLAPRTYLGEDAAGTMQLWLEPGEEPATTLSRELFQDPALTAVHGLPFTYQADQPFNPKHKDTQPPSRLSSGRPIQSAVTDSVQYDADVTLTADLGKVLAVKETEVTVFQQQDNYSVASIRTQISDDGRQWTDVGLTRCPNVGPILTVPITLRTNLRYARLTLKRGVGAERLLVGAIKFLPMDAAAQSAAAPVAAIRPMHVKATLENALREAKVDYLYGCLATDLLVDEKGQPAGVVMANRAGRQAVIGQVIIDATESAIVARLAGAAFTEFQAGKQTVKWVTIAGQAQTSANLKVRTLPFSVNVLNDKGTQASAAKASWLEYTLELDLAGSSWSARADLEQAVRNQTYHASQLYSSDVPWMAPPSHLKLAGSGEWPGAAKVDLNICRAPGVPRVWVLSGWAAVPRAQVAQLMRPIALLELGARVGVAAAAEAKSLPQPIGVKVHCPANPAAYVGEVREPLDGLRPLPAPAQIPEEARFLPVLGRYDVVVVGGGTSGAAAGVGAARQGAKTLVVEYLHGLGGVGTLGMIGKWWYGNRVGFTATVPQNPTEVRMEWLRHEILKAGGEVWFGCLVNGALVESNRVTGVIVATPQGRGVVLAKVVIDGTGNADVAAAAGAPTRFVDDNFALQNSHMPPREVGASYINGELAPVDVADPLDVRQALAQRKERFFDRGQLVDSRERRRIVGDYTLDWLDQINERTFPDTIVYAQSDYDSHGYQVHPFFMLRSPRPPEDHKFQFHSYLPYRCLLPRGLEGILVVGAGLSVHRDALPIVRMQPDLQNTGFAAGLAAAMAVKAGIAPRQVDVKALQRRLIAAGNLSAGVLSHRDSFPIPASDLAAAVPKLLNDYAGLELLMAQPQDALPLLHQAYDRCATNKLVYAQVLGVMGDAYGLDTLMTEAQRRLRERDFSKHGDNGNVESLACLLWALGGTGDPRVVPLLCSFTDQAARMSFQRLRAIVVSLGKAADPRAAPALAGLLKSRAGGDPGQLIVACALYRCGDLDSQAKTFLEAQVQGPSGPHAQLAWQVLQAKP